MRIIVDQHWRVDAAADLSLPMQAATAWGQMRDWRRFMIIDPLHVRVRVLDERKGRQNLSPAGLTLIIEHRFLGIGPNRIGRMLRWREGQGFAFSDLSQMGT